MSMNDCIDCVFKGKQVKYKGDITSPFVIVGDAPRALEVAKGIPFIGHAGELLDNMLKDLKHMLPDNVLITNALQCLVKQKDPKKISTACQSCNPRLLSEISAHPRKVILALGNAALHSLTGDYSLKITKERGKLFKSPLAEKGIVACFHPAHILRGGGNMQQFRRDIEYAVSLYTGSTQDIQRAPKYKYVEGTFKVITNKTDYIKLIQYLKLQPADTYIGYDLETDGFDPRKTEGEAPTFMGEGILCAGVSLGKDKTYVIKGDLIDDQLFQISAQQCWHNGKYDIGWLWEKGFKSARVDHDSMLMSYLLNERGGIHDLEQVGHDWMQAPNYKNMLEKYLPSKKHSYANIPKDVLYKYQALDAQLTQELNKLLHSNICADNALIRAYNEVIIPASDFLSKVENNGLYIDKSIVKHNIQELGSEQEMMEMNFKVLSKEAAPELGDINMKSPKQLKTLLYGHLKLAPIETSTDADTLAALPSHPVLEPLLRYRKVQKLLSTFVKPLLEKVSPDGRLHSTFKLHGTTTGRLSSNKPNLQNIPRDKRIRRQFAAAPGYVIVDCDLSQAELRVLACLSNDKLMVDIFSQGRSIHDEMAIKLFGKDFNKEQKMIAKNVNFGIIYGITEYGLSEQINVKAQAQGSTLRVTKSEARQWINGWYDSFPSAAEYIKRCRDMPKLRGTLISPFGRKRRFTSCGFDKLFMLQNEAANFPEQSTAHDITLVAGIRTIDKLKQQWNARIVNEVHDCLLIETPDNMKSILEVAKYVTDTMREVPRDYGLTQVPFESEPDVSYNWGEGQSLDLSLYAQRDNLKHLTWKEYKNG